MNNAIVEKKTALELASGLAGLALLIWLIVYFLKK